MEVDWYEQIFANAPACCKIVTSESGIPGDMRGYDCMIWSSHGRSDPMSWRASRLRFGNRVFTAEDIMKDWALTCGCAVLSACETGTDLSGDEWLDDYCGLDAAVQAAGAKSVFSTMWSVKATAAAFFTTQLLEGMLQGKAPGGHLRAIRQVMRTGRWRTICEEGMRQSKSNLRMNQEQRTARLDILEQVLSIGDDTFADPSCWGAFRCFGRPW